MKNRSKRQAETSKRERGSILATSAIAMTAVLLAVGLAVDISRLYLVKTELQNAADAAALAAVSALNGGSGGIDKAVELVTATPNKYDFNKTGITITNIEFSATLEGGYVPAAGAKGAGIASTIRFVRVTTEPSAVAISFAQMILGSSKDLTATATAGYSAPLCDICDFLPVAVIDYGTPISPGQTYTFRAQSGSMISPGNFQILALAGAGGNDARVGLGAGVDACAGPGAEYAVDTKTGVTSGAVRQGVNTRFDEYTSAGVNPEDMPPDLNIQENINYDDYKKGSPSKPPTHTGFPNRRVVYIPIVKAEEFDQGRNVVKFNRIGQFFLQTKVSSSGNGDLRVEYINEPTLGIGTYGPGCLAMPLLATPVLYK